MYTDGSPILGNAKTIVDSNPTALRTGAGDGSQQQASSITFLDPLIETADVFRDFLALVCNAQIRDSYWMPRGHLLVAFLQKWECLVALSHFVLLVQVHAPELFVSPLRAFAVCAAAKDLDACCNILRSSNFGAYPDPPSGAEFLKAWETHGQDSLDPLSWPGYMWTEVPPAYAWALKQAYKVNQEIGDVPGRQFAEGFKESLKTAEGIPPTHKVCQVLSDGWPNCPNTPKSS